MEKRTPQTRTNRKKEVTNNDINRTRHLTGAAGVVAYPGRPVGACDIPGDLLGGVGGLRYPVRNRKKNTEMDI